MRRRPPAWPAMIRISALLEEFRSLVGRQDAHAIAQRRVGRERRVGLDDGPRSVPRLLDERLVPDHFEETEGGTPTRLRGPEDVALTPSLEIHARQGESVRRRSHGSESLASG